MTIRRVGIYCRISNDKEGGGLGVTRQEDDCRLLAAALGWQVIDVYVDNDVSAADRRKVRHHYQRLLQDLRSDRIDAVISWHTDRLHRQPRELEDFIDLVESKKIEVTTVKAGVLDLTTPAGRMTARVHAAIAKHEVEHKRERVQRKVEELARAGKIHNGGHRPFGYTRIYKGDGPGRKVLRDEINPAEAKIVRECAQRLLEGQSLYSIVKGLNEQGITSSTGRPWTQQAMRYMLMSGRIAGLKEHRREVVGKAVWPAIITEDDHTRLRSLLIKPGRVRDGLREARKHPLSGLVRCTCSPDHIVMRVGRGSDRKSLVYGCPAKGEGGCGGRVIKLEALTDLMKLLALRRLDEIEAISEDAPDNFTAELEGKITKWERRLEELRDEFADGEQTAREYREVTKTLRDRIDSARFEIAKHGVQRRQVDVTAAEMREGWDGWTIERKRTVYIGLFEKILIYPATRPFSVFNPARVVTVPR